MSTNACSYWSEADFCQAITADTIDEPLDELAATTYERVCRTDFGAPGFCLLDFQESVSSQGLRRWMIALKEQMQQIHRVRRRCELILLSAGRFDQQVTTKPHRDGGPEECVLLLGYEPSLVPSELYMSDYAHCAHELGLTPAEFLATHNPMFAAGEELLQHYTTRITCFSSSRHQIVCINNSMAPYAEDAPAWQGVLHTARIHLPDESSRRIVNSVMIASAPAGTPEPLSPVELDEFLQTTRVRRSGYDKPNLADDE